MLEPDYYYDGRARYIHCDIGANDDCGYSNDPELWLKEAFDIYYEVVGIYKEWVI